jgi:hypothetical protein
MLSIDHVRLYVAQVFQSRIYPICSSFWGSYDAESYDSSAENYSMHFSSGFSLPGDATSKVTINGNMILKVTTTFTINSEEVIHTEECRMPSPIELYNCDDDEGVHELLYKVRKYIEVSSLMYGELIFDSFDSIFIYGDTSTNEALYFVLPTDERSVLWTSKKFINVSSVRQARPARMC